jgi:hypothetical protein
MKGTVIACVMVWSTSAPAGPVTFDPPVREVDPAVETRTTFDVVLERGDVLTEFTAVGLVIGSDDLEVFDWEYAIKLDVICEPACYGPVGIYPSDIVVDLFGLFGHELPVLFGRVFVDASQLPVGTYTLMVDPVRDGGISVILDPAGNLEPLFGVGTVNVIPEPATLFLCGVGLLGLLSHRRAG